MGKEKILKRLREIADEIIKEGADVVKLEKEANELRSSLEAIEMREKILSGIADGSVESNVVDKPENEEPRSKANESEKRGKAIKEMRSVTVASGDLVVPTHQADDIKKTFNEISTLLDGVTVKPLKGGESFDQPYEIGTGEGGYTAEGSDYTTAEPRFGYAKVGKAKITAYAEDTEEVQKLPAADYDSVVMTGISKALKKKMTKEILVGDGATNHFVGIFSDKATAIDDTTDISIKEIDENTLDEIIYSYGGDENVEDTAVLILNKKDLKAFSKVKGSDKKKVYTIVNKGNTGTIDGIPFIINSACKAISDATTEAGDYCMAYGSLSNYTMAIFSDVDIQRSTDYKFKQGMIAHRGSVYAGGNVTAHNGFLRVKKGE